MRHRVMQLTAVWRDPIYALMHHAYCLSCNLSFPWLCRHRCYIHIRDMCIVCTASKQIWLQNADWCAYTCRYIACNDSLPLFRYKKYPFTLCADIWIDLVSSLDIRMNYTYVKSEVLSHSPIKVYLILLANGRSRQLNFLLAAST